MVDGISTQNRNSNSVQDGMENSMSGFWIVNFSRYYFIWRRHDDMTLCIDIRAPTQYPKIRLSVRPRKVSKPRDLYLELSDRSEIWQALRQQCSRCACQVSKRYDNLKYQSRGFETLRDLSKRRLFGYWDGAQVNTSYERIVTWDGWQ